MGTSREPVRLALRKLWSDHVIWTRQYIVAAVAGTPDADAAAGRLLKNQEDIGAAIATYYGQAEVHTHRSTHLAFMLVLAFLFFPFGRKHFGDPLGWAFLVDVVCLGVALGSQVYTLVNLDRFVDPGYSVTSGDVVVGGGVIARTAPG